MTEPISDQELADVRIRADHEAAKWGYTIWTRLVARLDAVEAQRDALLAEVREWICAKCAYEYPGPPQPGLRCVICPRCNGKTMPKTVYEHIRLTAEVDRAWRAWKDLGDIAQKRADHETALMNELDAVRIERDQLRVALGRRWDVGQYEYARDHDEWAAQAGDGTADGRWESQ